MTKNQEMFPRYYMASDPIYVFKPGVFFRHFEVNVLLRRETNYLEPLLTGFTRVQFPVKVKL